jgi:iron(II)-dependent oxidoreductase
MISPHQGTNKPLACQAIIIFERKGLFKEFRLGVRVCTPTEAWAVAMRPQPRCALAALLATLAAATMNVQTLAGPASPAAQPAWLANITRWRSDTRAALNFSDSLYRAYLPWTTSLVVAPQVHIYDRFLCDPATGAYTVERLLSDFEARYGAIDGVSLWFSYPNLGVDQRSQLDLFEDLPGGLPALADLVRQFHARGVRVGVPYSPWDTGTAPGSAPDFDRLAQLGAALSLDYLNGDTMGYMPLALWNATVAAGRPLALQPEGGPSLPSLAWTLIGWGEGWIQGPDWRAPHVPAVDEFKWLERRHATQIVHRWGVNRTDDLHMVLFNGIGYVPWENVWGSWNGVSPRDGAALRRVAALLRYLRPFVLSQAWEPHAPLHPSAAAQGVFASRWPAPPGAAFPANATALTVVNRGGSEYRGPLLTVACGDGAAYFDLYAGAQLQPSAAPPPGGGGACELSVPLEAGGFGALLAVAPADAAGNASLAAFLAGMAAMTRAPLSSFNASWGTLQQAMTAWGATAPAAAAPPGMLRVPGHPAWRFAVNSTIIELDANLACDVQFPWEGFAAVAHDATLPVPTFFMDATPVTNAQYAAFLAASAYAPAQPQNFLRDWAGAGAYPAGWGAKPVTWVDLLDARAYCAFYGKRLPNDWEWQRGAQGDDGRQYPWGGAFEAGRVPQAQSDRARAAPPPDVGQHPAGASPFGLLDMVGLVWQWTNEFVDAHTRAATVRGGSYWSPQGSAWYFPNNLTGPAPQGVRVGTHNKLLLMAPSYDRHGTVGFRCVVDGPPL